LEDNAAQSLEIKRKYKYILFLVVTRYQK